MSSKIQVRRDTLANWNLVAGSVILAEGEIGYVTDTRNYKIGDGTNTWTNLKYQAPVYSGTNSTLAATTLAVDQTNNRVGIGTSTPLAKLDVSGSDIRIRASGTYADPTDIAGIIAFDTTSGDMTISSRSNSGSTAIALRTATTGTSSEKVRITAAGNVGIGTTAPSDQLHIEGAGPIIRLKDTTSTTAEYATIDADTSTGSISINANQGNLAAVTGTALVALKVNTTERLRANATGVAVSGVLSTSGLYTASAGITVPTGQTVTISSGATLSVPSGATLSVAGTVALPAGSVEIADLANIATLTVLGNSTGAAAAVAALTSGSAGTARTALGIPVAAYTPVIYNNALAALQNIALATSPPTVTLDITSNTIDVDYWYKWTTTSTAGGNTRTALIKITCPAGSSFIFELAGKTEGTNWATAANVDRQPVAAGVAVQSLTLSNGSATAAGTSTGWFSVKRITAV